MVLLCRCSFKHYVILLALLILLVGCRGQFNYQVRVQDSCGLPVKNAHIELAVGGNFAVLSSYTVDDGYALIEVDASRAGKQAKLNVSANGFAIYSQYVNLDKDTLPDVIVLEKPNFAGSCMPTPVVTNSITPTSTDILPPTVTPVQPTDVPTMSPPSPTFTGIPADTPTSIPTNTPMPPPAPVNVQVQAVEDGRYVYAGPDSTQPHMGVLRLREAADVIGKTQQGEWLQVVTSRGIEGWVDPEFVEFITGSLDQVPITWSGAVTPPQPQDGENGAVQQSCVTVTVSKRDVPLKAFDDVTLDWSNAPSGTARLWLSVYISQADGSKVYAVDPTYSDLITPYIIHEWVFADRHFAPGTTFTYTAEAQDAGGNKICTTTGAFVP
jgi:hypothetical protein